MSFTQSDIVSLIFKKYINNKSDVESSRFFFEEPYSSRKEVLFDDVWSLSDQIPNVAATVSGITEYITETLSWVEGTDGTYVNTNLKDTIPSDFGDGESYKYNLYRNDGVTRINQGEVNWLFDNNSGVLRFYNNSGLEDGVVVNGNGVTIVNPSLPPIMKVWKYIGDKGIVMISTSNGLTSSEMGSSINVEIDPNSAGDGLSFTTGVYDVNVNSDSLEITSDTIRLKDIITGDRTFQESLTVGGDLTVIGTFSTTNVDTLIVNNNNIILNASYSGPPILDAYIEVNRGGSVSNTRILWNESIDYWQIGPSGSESTIITEAGVGLTKSNDTLSLDYNIFGNGLTSNSGTINLDLGNGLTFSGNSIILNLGTESSQINADDIPIIDSLSKFTSNNVENALSELKDDINSISLGYIDGITAGDGLIGGGTSGFVTLELDPNSAGNGLTYSAGVYDVNVSNGLQITSDSIEVDFTTVSSIAYVDAAISGITGDITGITAGDGLIGGGTSGFVTIELDPNSAGSGLTYTAGVYNVNVSDGLQITGDSIEVDFTTVSSIAYVDAAISGITGDITGVTAGDGLIGGGTSGFVTIELDPNSAGSGLTYTAGVYNVNLDSNSLEITGDNVSLKQNISGDRTFLDSVFINGNLSVLGTTSNIYTENLYVEDNIITLNATFSGTPILNAGIEVNRGTETYSTIIWNESINYWQLGLSGSESTIITEAGSGLIKSNNELSLDTVTLAGSGLTSSGNTLNVNVSNGLQITSDSIEVDFTTVSSIAYVDAAISGITADITGVTAGDGLIGGGTSGFVTLELDPNSAGNGLTYSAGVYDVNVSNGLSLNSDNVVLGGSLNESVTQLSLGAGNIFAVLDQNSSWTSGLVVLNNEVYIQSRFGSTYSRFETSNNRGLFLLNTLSGLISIDFSVLNGAILTDTLNNKGIEYASDYSSNFTSNSLVNKSYVDSVVSGLSGSNGTITGITAGDGLIGGGTSGFVTLELDPNSAGSGLTYSAGVYDVNVSNGLQITGDSIEVDFTTVSSIAYVDAAISGITGSNGTITGITAGDGLIGGGTSGFVTLELDPNSAGNGLTYSAGVYNVNLDSDSLEITGDNISLKQNISGDRTFLNSVSINGNLTVLGTTSNIHTENLYVEDNIITLNATFSGTPILNAGIEVNRGTETYSTIIWNESINYWQLGLSGSESTIITEAGGGLIKSNNELSLDTLTLAGNGLTSSGNILNVNVSNGLQITGDSIQVDFTTVSSIAYVDAAISGITADITGVTAGDGLIGGGTSGFVTLELDPNSAGNGLTYSAGVYDVNVSNGLQITGDSIQVDFTTVSSIAYVDAAISGITADITGVTAGDGLIGGGTSGFVTLELDPNSAGNGLTYSAGVYDVNVSNGLQITSDSIEVDFTTVSSIAYVDAAISGITADITGVTAGDGLIGGGTSGFVTLELDPNSAGNGLTYSAGVYDVNVSNGLQITGDSIQVDFTTVSSIAYVNNLVNSNNELSEILSNGNKTLGNDLIISGTDYLFFGDDNVTTAHSISGATGGQLFIDSPNNIQITAGTLSNSDSISLFSGNATDYSSGWLFLGGPTFEKVSIGYKNELSGGAYMDFISNNIQKSVQIGISGSNIINISDTGNTINTFVGDTTINNDSTDGLLKYSIDPTTTTSWGVRSIPDKGYVDTQVGNYLPLIGGTISGSLQINGNLTVLGTTSNIYTENLYVEDNIITLNATFSGTPILNAGIEVNRGTETYSTIIWNESINYWQLGLSGSESTIITEAGTSLTKTNNTLSVLFNDSGTSSTDVWSAAKIINYTSGLGGGSGITSLNGITVSSQFLTSSNDQNVILDISSSGQTHSFNVSWNGLLDLNRGGLNNSSFTASQILIVDSTTSSVVSSGYVFNDSGTSSTDIWSADKIINYTSGSSSSITVIGTTAASYSVVLDSNQTQYVGISYSSSSDIFLPNSPTDGKVVIVKDESGLSSLNPITIHGQRIDQSTTAVISLDDASLSFLWRNGTWWII